MRKLFAFICLFSALALFTACSGLFTEKEESGNISLDFSSTLQSFRSNKREETEEMTPEEKQLMELVQKYLKFKCEVKIWQVEGADGQRGAYQTSVTQTIPFTMDETQQSVPPMQITNVPVGITAHLSATITIEGYEEYKAASNELYAKILESTYAEIEAEIEAAIREMTASGQYTSEQIEQLRAQMMEYLRKEVAAEDIASFEIDEDMSLAGESASFVTKAGDNDVSITMAVISQGKRDKKPDDDDTEQTGEITGTSTQVDYNRPLELAYKNEDSGSTFKFYVKVSEGDYDSVEWKIYTGTLGNVTSFPQTINRTSQTDPLKFEVEGNKFIISSDSYTPASGLQELEQFFTSSYLEISCTVTRNGVSETVSLSSL